MTREQLEATLGIERTIKVQNWSGEKRVTRDEYVSEWEDQASELIYLAWSAEDRDIVRGIQATVKRLAGQKFDRLWDWEREDDRKEERIYLGE